MPRFERSWSTRLVALRRRFLKFVAQKRAPTTLPPDASAQEEAQLEADQEYVLAELECEQSLVGLIQVLTHDLGIAEHELAMLTGASARFVLKTGRNDETPYVERLDDLAAIAALLIRHGGIHPSQVSGWLRARNRDLSLSRPLDALRYRGFLPVYRAAEAACDVLPTGGQAEIR